MAAADNDVRFRIARWFNTIGNQEIRFLVIGNRKDAEIRPDELAIRAAQHALERCVDKTS